MIPAWIGDIFRPNLYKSKRITVKIFLNKILRFYTKKCVINIIKWPTGTPAHRKIAQFSDTPIHPCIMLR